MSKQLKMWRLFWRGRILRSRLLLAIICALGIVFLTLLYAVSQFLSSDYDYFDRYYNADGESEDFEDIAEPFLVCDVSNAVESVHFDNLKVNLERNETVPTCLEDKSMFRMAVGSKLVRLHLEDPFWRAANCCYEHLWRIAKKPDFEFSLSSSCYEIHEEETLIPSHQDFLRITCKDLNSSRIIYQDQLAHIRKDPEHLDAVEDFKASTGEGSKGEDLSIMIFGIQSMSALSVPDVLPKTTKLLKSLNTLEFNGFNSLGQGPLENIYPLLTGKTYQEIFNDCKDDKMFLDNCPGLRLGWTGMYHRSFQEEHGESSLFSIGSRYVLRGFKKSPIEMDLRLLNQGLEWLKLGHEGSQNGSKQCYGPRLGLKSSVDNFKLIAETFQDSPHFHLTWSSTFRDFPSIGDDLLANMLRELTKNESTLNRTIVILMSDDGTHSGQERYRYMPQEDYVEYESKLPFLSMILPEWADHNFPETMGTLVRNRKNLITTLDVHEFLQDIVSHKSKIFTKPETRERESGSVRTYKGDPSRISLFRRIPVDRTCKDAKISDLYCICRSKTSLNTDDKEVESATSFILTEMNKKLTIFSNCAKLILEQILRANLLNSFQVKESKNSIKSNGSNESPLQGNETLTSRNSKKFSIIFTTSQPGPVIWEATVVASQVNIFHSVEIRRVQVDPSVKLCITHNELYPNCVCY